MKAETKFWKRIKPHLPSWSQRFELKAALGVPDLHLLIEGEAFWLELKAQVDPLGLAGPQASWLTRHWAAGGNCGVLAQEGSGAVLWPGSRALALLDGDLSQGARVELHQLKDEVPRWLSR